MAKSSNLPSKRYMAGERTATKIRLMADWDGGSPDRNHYAYVDIAQCLSAMNQRAYRQGLYYYVAGVSVFNSNEESTRVIFSTAPDTWTTKQAWKRGFTSWMKMQREAMQETGAIQSKYADYKVFLDDEHYLLKTTTTVERGSNDSNDTESADVTHTIIGAGNNLSPLAFDKLSADTGDPSGAEILTNDEWTMSEYVAPDHGASGGTNQVSDKFTAHIVGNHDGTDGAWDSVGLIRSYTMTRPQMSQSDDEPDLFSAYIENDPIVAVFDSGDTHEAIINDLDDHNDQPPYDHDSPFGISDDQLYQVQQVIVQGANLEADPNVATSSQGAVGSLSRASGFCVPFGLLRIDCTGNTGVEIHLDIVPGQYHGVHAERVV